MGGNSIKTRGDNYLHKLALVGDGSTLGLQRLDLLLEVTAVNLPVTASLPVLLVGKV